MKIYSIICNKYRKFKNSKISCIFKKTLDLSIVYIRYGHEYKKYLNKKNQLKY